MSRFLTTIVQLALLISTFYLLRLAIQDIKENGFQFSNPEHDLNCSKPPWGYPQGYPQGDLRHILRFPQILRRVELKMSVRDDRLEA